MPRARATDGTTSASERSPYAGSVNPSEGLTAGCARERLGELSRPVTASVPSATAETRSEKSSPAMMPV